MDLDRGTLARIDRKLLAGLGQYETFRMVRVPVTAAKWATWKRYCSAAGISIGRSIMMLIEHELLSAFGGATEDEVPLFAVRAEEQSAAREAEVDASEREVKAAEERIRRQDERLRLWEDQLEARERRAELVSKLDLRPSATSPKVGRNERCSCGSGLKYKRCHGRVGTTARSAIEAALHGSTADQVVASAGTSSVVTVNLAANAQRRASRSDPV